MEKTIWIHEREKKVYDVIENKTDKYFNDLYLKTQNSTSDLILPETNDTVSQSELVYRESQHNYALDVMYAIRNKKILLIQAGVGCGKSYGYLIPIFNTYAGVKGENVTKFEKIIISTSNIALQYQLIRDINLLSKELSIPLSAVIAKGVNNYACIQRIEKIIHNNYTSESRREELKSILAKIREVGSSDKFDLIDIDKDIWQYIQLCGRGYCSKCHYVKECSFYQTEKKIKNSNIIITNHANYVSNLLKSVYNNSDEILFSKNADMVIIDEAHKFEENIINVLESELQLGSIFFNLDKIYSFIIERLTDEINIKDQLFHQTDTKEKFRYMFLSIKKSAIENFNKNNNNEVSITDGNRLSFKFNDEILSKIKLVKDNLEKIKEDLTKSDKLENEDKRIQLLNYLKELICLLDDMSNIKRKYIYWVRFFEENSINLGYVIKDKTSTMKHIFNNDIPIVLTSATMLDENDSYTYFKSRLGLDNFSSKLEEANEHLSPFDYDNNALFYYDSSIAPYNDKENNIIELATKISELINITNGKALILFTSKQRMQEVYNLVSKNNFSFKLLLQDDSNADLVRKEFESDTNACLFATGSFWEGISIKGVSLSNLIITHLPFDNVDAINETEAELYVEEEKMAQVYVPQMLVKLKQAIGRLIRSDTDTGIVCCLDSKTKKYLDKIKSVSPIKNITTDIKDVIAFSDEKITNEEIKKHQLILTKK